MYSAEDIHKGKLCLDRVPLDVLPSKSKYYVAEYYLTLSDLHMCKGDYLKARKFAVQSKQLFVESKITNERACVPNKWLRLLKRPEMEDTELHKIT